MTHLILDSVFGKEGSLRKLESASFSVAARAWTRFISGRGQGLQREAAQGLGVAKSALRQRWPSPSWASGLPGPSWDGPGLALALVWVGPEVDRH